MNGVMEEKRHFTTFLSAAFVVVAGDVQGIVSFDSPVDECFVRNETRENVVNGGVLDSRRDRQALNNNNTRIDVKISRCRVW